MSKKDQKIFSDAYWMNEALLEGIKGRITSPPNPWVGCVIVKNGVIVGKGYHHSPGEAHAEVMALRLAKENAVGSTVYNTLEPCSFYGRTPPCVDALIQAQVKRVVIAIDDPDSHVSGEGIKKLIESGIEVITGVLKKKAEKNLTPYLYHRTFSMPYCVVKAAISLDGKIAAKDGSSKWISCEKAREDAHLLRAESQAVLIGANTARFDMPRLDVRAGFIDKQPLRVVVDAKGVLKPKGPLFDQSIAKTLIATSLNEDHPTVKDWENTGVSVRIYEQENGYINLSKLFKDLAQMGILQVLVEGGSAMIESVLDIKLAQKLILYVGNCIIGEKGLSLFKNSNLENINDALRFKHIANKQVGQTVRLEYEL